MSDFKTIVVDLTPLLPGAVNGGAKILVLELLDRLPRLMPETHFVLLTRKSSHDELTRFERDNVVRKLVWNDVDPPAVWTAPASGIPRSVLLAAAVTRRLPKRLRRARFDLRRILSADRTMSPDAAPIPTLLFSPFGLSEAHPNIEHSPDRFPTVAILYDLQHRRYPQFFEPSEVAKREQNLQSYRATSVLAAISDFVRDSAIEVDAIPEISISTVYIRLKHRIVDVDEGQIRQALDGLSLSAGRYLLYPANFWPHKNHDALFRAFAQARSDGLPADFKLVCTGAPGDGMHHAAKTADAFGLKGVIALPGFLTEMRFSALLRSARGVVFPSLYEGFGMPVIEAMAVGCPVACSDATSLSEIAADAALLFDPEQPADIARAILRLAADDDLRATLIEKGRRRADTFADTEHMARQYRQLFDRATERWEKAKGPGYLRGVYKDGWAAPSIMVGYGRGSTGRTMRLQLQVPASLPIGFFELSVADPDGGRPLLQRLELGAAPVIELPIGPEAGLRHLRIKPFFRPIELHETADCRELTVQVRRIEIGDAARTVTMFSGRAA